MEVARLNETSYAYFKESAEAEEVLSQRIQTVLPYTWSYKLLRKGARQREG